MDFHSLGNKREWLSTCLCVCVCLLPLYTFIYDIHKIILYKDTHEHFRKNGNGNERGGVGGCGGCCVGVGIKCRRIYTLYERRTSTRCFYATCICCYYVDPLKAFYFNLSYLFFVAQTVTGEEKCEREHLLLYHMFLMFWRKTRVFVSI